MAPREHNVGAPPRTRREDISSIMDGVERCVEVRQSFWASGAM